MAAQKQYITAISIQKGIINVIEPNGEIGAYAQKGIKTLSQASLHELIYKGALDPTALILTEIPANYNISFEEPSIMGRASKTFKPF